MTICTNCISDFSRYVFAFEYAFFLAYFSFHVFLESYNFFDFFMSCHDNFKNSFFWNLLSTTFNHQDSIFCTSYNDIKVCCFQLFFCWINNKFTIDTAHANACDRTIPRNIRNRQCCRCTNHTTDCRITILINRHDSCHYVYFITYTFIK